MTAATRNFVIEQGATFKQRIVWKDSSSVPVNLTGYSARMQARRSKTATEVLVELTTANGRIALGGAAGTIDLTIPADVTDTFTWTRGLFDLELVKPNGEVVRLLRGEFTVSSGVTR